MNTNISARDGKKGSTLFLKVALICMAVVVLAICIFAVPSAIKEGGGFNEYALFWIILYLTTIPFFIALLQAMKMLNYIDQNTAFSQNSVKALNTIKYCGIAISALYVACLPYIYKFADMDDAPGAILYWMVLCAAPLVISTFAALLKLLLERVLEIKSENDLTV